MRSATGVPGEAQDPDLSTSNATTSPSLSTKLWAELNADSEEVRIINETLEFLLGTKIPNTISN